MAAYRESVQLQQRAVDANGDRTGAWATAATLAAQIIPLVGGQVALDQRLQGRQPYAITLRACAASQALDNSWRLVNARTGVVYDVTAAVLSVDRQAVNVSAVQKVGQPNG